MTDLKTHIPTPDPRTAFLKEALLRDLRDLVHHIEAFGLEYDSSGRWPWEEDPYEQERLEEIVQNYLDFVVEARGAAYVLEFEHDPQADAVVDRARKQRRRAAWKALLKQVIRDGIEALSDRGEDWCATITYYQSCGVEITIQATDTAENVIPLRDLGDRSSPYRFAERVSLHELRSVDLDRWLDRINRALTMGNTRCFQ